MRREYRVPPDPERGWCLDGKFAAAGLELQPFTKNKGTAMRRNLVTMLLTALVLTSGSLLAQGKISGVFYGDYFYNVARDTNTYKADLPNAALKGPKSNQGFVIRRVYFGYDYDMAEQFAMRFRVELDQTGSNTLASGNMGVFVKDAWLRWKNVVKGSDLFFGIQPTAAFDISEGLWGYRGLEKTIMDLRGIVSSRGLGVAMKGKIDDEGMFGYWVMVANQNSGTQAKDNSSALAQGDKYNSYSLNLAYRPSKEVTVTVYGDFRPNYPVNDPTSTAVPKATVGHAKSTLAAFACYKSGSEFAVGVEGFSQMTSNNYRDPASTAGMLKSQGAFGLSFWAWYNFSDDVGAVVRYDTYDPKTGSDNTEKGDSRGYLLAGLVCKPAKNVQVIPNFQLESYESIPNGPSLTSAVTGRVTFIFSY
jgi:hypothetical protein